MLIESITYSGDGNDDRNVSFAGALAFVTPDVVIVKSDQGQAEVWSSITMATGESGFLSNGGANTAGLIKSLINGGFTVGTDDTVNNSSRTYYAVGFYDDGNGDFEAFTYTGDGADPSNRDILSFQPNFICIKQATGTKKAVVKFEEQTGDATYEWTEAVASVNKIQAFRSLGFELGSSSWTNTSSTVYHGFAFKNVDGFCDSHTYAGASGDDRQITVQGTTFEPDFVLVKRESAVAGQSQFVGSWYTTTDKSFILDSGTWPTTDHIQNRNPTGFEVGDNNRVNVTGGDTFYYLAVKSNPAASPETEDQIEGDGFTELTDSWIDGSTYVNSLHAIWRADNDTTVDSSSASAWALGGIAVEIVEAGSASVTAGLSGTATPFIGDTDIVAGGKTIVLNLTNDTWVAAGTGPIGSTAVTQAIIDGLDSAQSEGTGWNAEVRDKEVVGAVVRTSDATATITLTAAASYVITADETITATIPAPALVASGSAVIASPTLVVTQGQFESNGDVNWLNPPTLPGLAEVSESGTDGSSFSFKTIDAASGNAFSFTNCTNITIENCLITNAGNNGIYTSNCSGVTIRNCKIVDTMQGTHVALEGAAIWAWNPGSDWLVEGNWFENNAAGVIMQAASLNDNMIFRGNYCKNPQKNTAGSTSNFIGIYYSTRMTGIKIYDNVMNGAVADCWVEDWISLFQSGGSEGDHILIYGNKVKGSGASNSGGGFLLGDKSETHPPTNYITASNNRLVDPGQYGLAIAGGHDNIIINNDIFSSYDYALEASGASPGTGIYVWRQQGSEPGDMYNCTVSGNDVLFYSNYSPNPKPPYPTPFEEGSFKPSTGSDSRSPNHGTIESGNVNPTGWSTNDFSHSAWDSDSGNQGYTDLPVPSTWVYYPPS